jgi:kynurenine formamidase
MNLAQHSHAKWGAADRIGAANLITPASRLAALSLVTRGAVYQLGRQISAASPFLAPNQTPFVLSTAATWRNTIKIRRGLGAENDAGSNLERIEMNVHVGAHIDALGHFSIGDELYGGRSAFDGVGDHGLVDLGIENCPPIIAQGVCLDLSGLDGGPHLDRGRAITADDLARTADAAGVEIKSGDVVCLHSGWGRYYVADNAKYCSGEPGIDEGAARWLTKRDVIAIAADSMAVEVLPNPRHPKLMMPVHQHCLTESGVYLIENLFMDELVRDNVTRFCFILLPVPFKGATGSPAQPVAMI